MNECTPQGCGTGLQYLLTNHLGSVVATTDSTGTLTSQQRYLPFGGVRADVPSANVPSTDYGYTGQRNLDAEIGLMDYKARFYSPYLNRFIQPDTLIPDPSNPQAWNRYSYVVNRPLVFNDPTGHCFEPVSMIVCGIGLVLIGTAMIMIGSSEMSAAEQQPTFSHEQQAVENWQNNCMGSCHYADHVSRTPNSTTGPRPLTPATDRYSKGMADVVLGVLSIMDGAYGAISGARALSLPRKSIMIGENQLRVNERAKLYGSETFDGEGMKANRQWIRSKQEAGYDVYDIGPDFDRRLDRMFKGERPDSPFYNMERKETKNYPTIKLWDRSKMKW